MKRKQTILNLILILVLCFSFITPFVLPQPVLAAEEEEEDNFTSMPNYRWENQSTTDPAVSERLIGDQYEISNTNNETTGTQKFEKSRKLNSRDFYYESRFALDVGGNQTEYFRDVLGDACDFEEGDIESFDDVGVTINGADDGVLDYIGSGSTSHRVYYSVPTGFTIGQEIYHTVRFKFKSNSSEGRLRFYSFVDGAFIQQNILAVGSTPTEWTTFEVTITNEDWLQGGNCTQVGINVDTIGVGLFVQYYLDFFEVIGNLDYATHVEDEIEDTWDFEDSSEYWYNEESNVSDFNDGTTENWEANSSSTVVSETSGWLKVEKTAYGTYMIIEDASISVDASIYKHIAIELYTTKQTITYVEFLDTDLNRLYIDEDDIPINTKKLIYAEFDGDWSGTEEKLIIRIQFPGSLNDHNTYINMTYLYDTELGDVEEITVSRPYKYVNPEGYLTNSFEVVSSQIIEWVDLDPDIKLDQFNLVKFRLFTWSNIRFRLYGDITGTGDTFFSEYLIDPTVGAWTDYEYDLRDYLVDGTLIDDIGFAFYDGSGNFEGDEYLLIDYFLLLGHWSETDGFKYSLLNADDEEGMSFQFTRNADTSQSYDISIDMYDSVGVALGYSYSFDYSLDIDGWLRIRVDWHLDKKNVKILLEFDNGTDIINIRRITDLYGNNVGFSRLLLLEEGFPSLCLNNSIHAFARSYVIIDYVDADWIIIDWKEPVGVWNFYPSHTSSQDLETYFSSISPYGVTAYHKNVSNRDHWYMLNVDRFDGLSFDWKTSTEDLDTGDWCSFVMGVYNVRRNGSLEPLFLFWTLTTDVDSYVTYFVKDVEMIERTGSYVKTEGSISIFHESSTKIILDTRYSNAADDFQGTIEVTPDDEGFTKEMLFVFAYEVETDNSAATDDIVEISIGGFDLKRKDFIGDLVSAVLSPIVGFIVFLFSPFFMLFQFLVQSLMKGFKDLFAELEPLFGVLGDIFGVAIGALGTVFGTIIDGLETAFEGIIDGLGELLELAINGLWALLWGLAEDFADFMMAVLAILFVVLLGLAQIIVELIMGILDWVWVNVLEASPLGFVIVIMVNAIVASPVIIMDIINLCLFWSFWILIGVWIIVLPMQAAQSDSISEFFERVIGMLCFDVVPIEIAGFGLWVPLGIPLIFFTCAEIIVLV